MYKQVFMAICFATASLFSVSQVSAVNSGNLLDQISDAQIVNYVQDANKEELAKGLDYLASKGLLDDLAKRRFQFLGNCDDCEFHAQAAGNQVFQELYASSGDLNYAARESYLQYVCTYGDCIKECTPSISSISN